MNLSVTYLVPVSINRLIGLLQGLNNICKNRKLDLIHSKRYFIIMLACYALTLASISPQMPAWLVGEILHSNIFFIPPSRALLSWALKMPITDLMSPTQDKCSNYYFTKWPRTLLCLKYFRFFPRNILSQLSSKTSSNSKGSKQSFLYIFRLSGLALLLKAHVLMCSLGHLPAILHYSTRSSQEPPVSQGNIRILRAEPCLCLFRTLVPDIMSCT